MLTRELDAIDRACSRFRPDSELVRMNAASGEEVHVSPLLFDALRTALDAARASAGLVDPTIGRTLRLAGYDATFSVVRGRDGRLVRPSFVRDPDWRTVELDDDTSNRARAEGRRARPRRDREGARGRPRSEAARTRRRGPACSSRSAATSPLRASAPERRLVGSHRRGQRLAARHPRPRRRHLGRRPCDIGDDRAQLGEQRRSSSSHRRSSNRASREHALAHRDRRRSSRASMRTRRARRRSSSASVHRSGSPSCGCLRGSCVTTGGRSCVAGWPEEAEAA